MILIDYLLDNLLPILIATGGAIAWLFDIKRRKAEKKSIEVQNEQNIASLFKSMQESYRVLKEDMDDTVNKLLEENKDLRKRLSELESDLDKSNQERLKLIRQVEEFKKQSEIDAKLITSLKNKIESYEKEVRAFRKEKQ